MPVKTQCDLERESTLLSLAVGGDRSAAESLLVMHTPFIRSLARRFFCPEMQDELLQAGYTGLLRAIRRFDSSSGVRLLTYAYPWIIGEMKRTMRDSLKHIQALSLDDAGSEEEPPLIELIAGDHGIDIRYVDLHLALSSLPPDERLLICLRYYRDKSQAETALLLKKSQAQISKLERKALDRLVAMLT